MPDRTRRIKNWDKFQQYHTGKNAPKEGKRPEWIKLYTKLIDDYEFHKLDPVDAKALVLLWALASENGGTLPSIETISFRLRMPEKQIKSILSRLPNWIEGDVLGQSYDTPRPDKIREDIDKIEIEKRERRAIALPPEWSPTENHFSQGKELGFSRADVEGFAADMRYWALGKGETKKNWDMAFSGWIRRERKRGPPKTKSEQFRQDVDEFLQEVDSGNTNGFGRRALCGPSGGSNLGELHAAASRQEDDAPSFDGNAGRGVKSDFADDG
jgi:hypothetical protein